MRAERSEYGANLYLATRAQPQDVIVRDYLTREVIAIVSARDFARQSNLNGWLPHGKWSRDTWIVHQTEEQS
jgi:hypothetical protein